MNVRMSAAIRIACGCLVCLALAACGGSSASSASSNKQAITHMFVAMQSAMARGDYAGACSWLSERQQSSIVSGAKKAGLNASDCAGAFRALISTAGVSKAQLAQAFGSSSPKIRSLSVDGDRATVTYTDKDNGKTFTETDGLVKENGNWRADRTISRHNGS
ncbi:MAG TPA: hypothetical protein VJU80_16660 [Solirubrobacteraceae bacterium]|nr:hypothetical protein [Solirubrobacteraceae bacterium]